MVHPLPYKQAASVQIPKEGGKERKRVSILSQALAGATHCNSDHPPLPALPLAFFFESRYRPALPGA